MPHVAKIRRGSATPTINDLEKYELGWSTNDQTLYIHNYDGSTVPETDEIVPISGSVDLLEVFRGVMKDSVFPVGSLYITTEYINPSEFIDGTFWELVNANGLIRAAKTVAEYGNEGGIISTTKEHDHDLNVNISNATTTHSHTVNGFTDSKTITHGHGTHTHSSGFESGGKTATLTIEHTHTGMNTMYDGSDNWGTEWVIAKGSTYSGNSTGYTNSAGNHNHEFTVEEDATINSMEHTHSISTPLTVETVTATHTHDMVISVDESGVGNTMYLWPPYLSVYIWRRTA